VYASRGINPTSNASDGIFADSLSAELVTPVGSVSGGYTATFQVAVSLRSVGWLARGHLNRIDVSGSVETLQRALELSAREPGGVLRGVHVEVEARRIVHDVLDRGRRNVDSGGVKRADAIGQ